MTTLLNETDKQSFNEYGFWLSHCLFTHDMVMSLRQAIFNIWKRGTTKTNSYEILGTEQDDRILRRAFNVYLLDDVIKEAVLNHKIGQIACELLEVKGTQLWYHQIIDKPGFGKNFSTDITNIGWHQDYKYWQCCSTSNMLSAWIALQDTTIENGTLRFVLGSHKWGLLDYHKGFNTKNLDEGHLNVVSREKKPWVEDIISIKAGQVCFHHALTLHASGPNISTESRLGLSIHIMPLGTKYLAHVDCHQSLTFFGQMPKPNEPFHFHDKQWPILFEK